VFVILLSVLGCVAAFKESRVFLGIVSLCACASAAQLRSDNACTLVHSAAAFAAVAAATESTFASVHCVMCVPLLHCLVSPCFSTARS
jgi:hypothetical protein